MIVANLAEGLLVPIVSFSLNSIPSWNEHNPKDIKGLFEFANCFVIDDALLL